MNNITEAMYNQLGGNKFLAMTGAKIITDDKNNKLIIQLQRNTSKANKLEITYNEALDLYTMNFYRFTMGKFNPNNMTFTEDKLTPVAYYERLFFDQLQEIFTQVTGMYTHL